MMIKNDDVTIGFEVETTTDYSYSEIEDWFFNHNVEVDNVDDDGSLSSDYYSYCLEVKTKPVVYQSIDYQNFFEALKTGVNEGVLNFNETTGLHFHVSLKKNKSLLPLVISKQDIIKYEDMIKKDFNTLWVERAKNDYCTAYSVLNHSFDDEVSIMSGSRYRSVNLKSFQAHHTIEFRFFSGNALKLDGAWYYRDFVEASVNWLLDVVSKDFRKPLVKTKLDINKQVLVKNKKEGVINYV